MSIIVNDLDHYLDILLPLTTPTGKVRVKHRSVFHQYGTPHSTRKKILTLANYIEWQIGYDLPFDTPNLRSKTTLPDIGFKSGNNKDKVFYELSEYLYYFSIWSIIGKEEILNEMKILDSYSTEDLLDRNEKCQIVRSHPVEEDINDLKFLSMAIKYPQLVYQFGDYEILAEVTIREKQRAVGVQPMLYFCIPIVRIRPQYGLPILIGRCAETRECGYFRLDRDNYRIILQIIRIFGMLSENHRDDMKGILEATLRSLSRMN